jgi:hypothetical protein
LAASDKGLVDALVRYGRHVAVYKALRSSGNRILIATCGKGVAADVFGKIKRATLARREEFDEMLQDTLIN